MDPITLTLVGAGLGIFIGIIYYYLRSDDSEQNAQELQDKVTEVHKLVSEREEQTQGQRGQNSLINRSDPFALAGRQLFTAR
jgi:hypothetical protein